MSSDTSFLMRAKQISTEAFVYWTVSIPDPTGTSSGVSVDDLEDVVCRIEFGSSLSFLMRAKQISTGNFVYWTTFNVPDPTGTSSGISPADLTDISIQKIEDIG